MEKTLDSTQVRGRGRRSRVTSQGTWMVVPGGTHFRRNGKDCSQYSLKKVTMIIPLSRNFSFHFFKIFSFFQLDSSCLIFTNLNLTSHRNSTRGLFTTLILSLVPRCPRRNRLLLLTFIRLTSPFFGPGWLRSRPKTPNDLVYGLISTLFSLLK